MMIRRTMQRSVVCIVLLATAAVGSDDCKPLNRCASGHSPVNRLSALMKGTHDIDLSTKVVFTRLFEIKQPKLETCIRCDPTAVTILPVCSKGVCVDFGTHGCCQDCPDDPWKTLVNNKLTCPMLKESIGCNAQLANLGERVAGYPHMSELCPHTCGTCKTASKEVCSKCTRNQPLSNPVCLINGHTARETCDTLKSNCAVSGQKMDLSYEEACVPPVYGIIRHFDIHANKLTIEEADPLCADGSIPHMTCPSDDPLKLGNDGPTFDGAYYATKHTMTLGTVLASRMELGAGMYVRASYTDAVKKSVNRVDILHITPPDLTDLSDTVESMTGDISLDVTIAVVDNFAFWMMVRLKSGHVFNVTSDTRVRNVQTGDSLPLSVSDLVRGTNVKIDYVGPANLYPNVIQAVGLTTNTTTPLSQKSCKLTELYCSVSDSCSTECQSLETKCVDKEFVCDGTSCKPGSECSGITDVWGKLIKYISLLDKCPGSVVHDKLTCSNGEPQHLMEVHIDSRKFIITTSTIVSTRAGWKISHVDVGDVVRAGYRSAARVEVFPSSKSPDILHSFTLLDDDAVVETCRDDPNGILNSVLFKECSVFLGLGCDYDLYLYSNMFPRNTPLRSVCKDSCGECRNISTDPVDICKHSDLSACVDYFLENGCPNEGWNDVVVCRPFKFCTEINTVIAKVCEVVTAPPHEPCSLERERAMHGTVGAYVPECSSDGVEWLPKQCHLDECWCADVVTGSAMSGTRTTATQTLSCGLARDKEVKWCDSSHHTKLCSNPAECPTPVCAVNECANRVDTCCKYKCEVVMSKIDLSLLHESRDIIQTVDRKYLTLTFENAVPEAVHNDTHDLLLRILSIRTNRLVLRFSHNMIDVQISFDDTLLNRYDVKNQTQIDKHVGVIQSEQQDKVADADAAFASDAEILKLTGPVLYSKEDMTPEHLVVGKRPGRKMEYVANFGSIGNITFTSDEYETLIKVNLPGLKSSGVRWMVHNTWWQENTTCPPADEAYYDPLMIGHSTYCVKAVGSRFEHCRVGDMVGKHGPLSAHSTQDFIDLSLPLNGMASVLNRAVVLGTNPPLCARIGEPLEEQLIAKFDGPYLKGSVLISQTELLRNTQVLIDLAWVSDIPGTKYNLHIHTEKVGTNLDTRCKSAGQHYNPLDVVAGKCPTSRSQQSIINCEIGDLSGKYGLVAIPGKQLFTDPIMDTVGSENSIVPNGVDKARGKSIVVHAMDGSRIDCANLVLVAKEAHSPAYNTGGGGDDTENVIIVLVGALLAALVGYAVKHYAPFCMKRIDEGEESEDKKDRALVPPEAPEVVIGTAEVELEMEMSVRDPEDDPCEMVIDDRESAVCESPACESPVRESAAVSVPPVNESEASPSLSCSLKPETTLEIDPGQIEPDLQNRTTDEE